MGLRTHIEQVIQETETVLGADSPHFEGNKAIPQLQDTLEYIKNNPIEATRLFLSYRRLTYSMLNLSIYDLGIIESAHERYGYGRSKANLPTSSASKITTAEFLDSLGESRLGIINDFEEISPDNIISALKPLFEMMSNASLALQENPFFKPMDGDPISDRMIWGHTQIRSDDPRILLHFIIAHGIERYIVNKLGLEISKDSVLNALTDTLCLQYAKRSADPEIIKVWSNPKQTDDVLAESGLGWLKSQRLETFENALLEC